MRIPAWTSALFLSLGLLRGAAGQQPSQAAPAQLRLNDAVQLAVHNYPAVLAAQRAAQQTQAAVGLAKTGYLPDLRLVSQFDRATDNNTPGLLISNGLPTISGPVAPQYSWQSVWTSSAGAVLSWEVFDFGRRGAGVNFYRELAARSNEQVRQVQLDVAAHAADAFLASLAAEQAVKVAQADVERWQTVSRIVHVLVNQQLRPGADGSRADAELAGARIGLARAQNELDRARATLAEALGMPAATATLEGNELLARVPALPADTAGPDLGALPSLRAQQAAILATAAQQKQLRLADRPRFYLLGGAYGRGTGLPAGSRDVAVAGGFAPVSAGNWVAGVGIEYSFTRHWQNRHEQAIVQAQLQQDQARYAQLSDQLQLAWRQARADLNSAWQVLQAAPIELDAAEMGEKQARARYRAGLSAIVDLANAEELLAKAQTDDLISHLQIWRALLKLSYAQGDLNPFIQQVTALTQGGH